MPGHALELAHAAVTWMLVGLVWTIQLVHYPLFSYVEPARFTAFHAAHSARIALLVGWLMPLELAAAIALAVRSPSPWTWAGLGLVVLVWTATALLSVPSHARLTRGYDARAHAGLVAGNWVRTAGWSLRGAIALALLA